MEGGDAERKQCARRPPTRVAGGSQPGQPASPASPLSQTSSSGHPHLPKRDSSLVGFCRKCHADRRLIRPGEAGLTRSVSRIRSDLVLGLSRQIDLHLLDIVAPCRLLGHDEAATGVVSAASSCLVRANGVTPAVGAAGAR